MNRLIFKSWRKLTFLKLLFLLLLSHTPFLYTTKHNIRSSYQSLSEVLFTHRIPDIVIFNNGPQYSTGQFKEFAKDLVEMFTHLTSTSLHLQTNGDSEKDAQTAKNIRKNTLRSTGIQVSPTKEWGYSEWNINGQETKDYTGDNKHELIKEENYIKSHKNNHVLL